MAVGVSATERLLHYVAGTAEPEATEPESKGAFFPVSDADIVYFDLVRMTDKAQFNFTLDCSSLTTNVSADIVWCVLE